MNIKPILTVLAVALVALAHPVLAEWKFTQNEKGEVTHYNGIPLPPIQTVEEAKAKPQKEIAAARKAREAEHAAAASSSNLQSEVGNQQFFFTGKPYLVETGQYLFLFRNYDPKLSRWTVQDFVNFLDGPNNYKYAPIPTSSFDFLGLLDWATIQGTGVTGTASHASGYSWSYEIYTIKTDDHNHTIQMWKNLQPLDKPGGTTNCHGFTFASGQYWINPEWVAAIISGDGYKLITGSDKTGARVALWPNTSADHSAIVSEIVSGDVTKVTGLGGVNTIPSTTSPSMQWTGAVEYYE